MFLKSELLKAKHGFFTNQGGVSTGLFASLNCGYDSGDDKDKVKQNRDKVLKEIGGHELITAQQMHSDMAVIVSVPGSYHGDALVTNQPGLALGILTADCAPVLLEDEETGIIGAAHAGWRGARFGIIGSVIRAMQNLGASQINAVIGPCIQQESYEIDEEFLGIFASETSNNGKFFTRTKKPGHYLFDLPAYVEGKLYKNGVVKVETMKEDTLTQSEKFFSYRRSILNGQKQYGRQLSVICL